MGVCLLLSHSRPPRKTSDMQQKHFILVQGACHGAWCWYKVKPRLEAEGAKVTTVDLSASGINTRRIEEIDTLNEHSLPLLDVMESVPADEKVILVGHSFGGMNISLAMDKYTEKVSVGVFVAALLPDTENPPNSIVDELHEKLPIRDYLDTLPMPNGSPDNPRVSLLFKPEYLLSKLYQLCSAEDFALGKTLVRPVPNLSKEGYGSNFSTEGYGSVYKAYIICGEDKVLPESFQRWQIKRAGGSIEVKVIKDADHMAMFSKTKELCQCLLEIADKYHI